MELKVGESSTLGIILTNTNDGTPLTGITPSDVTMYILKQGGSPTLKTIDSGNFSEVGSSMPGLYRVTFTPTELDTVGQFIAVVQENTNVDLAQTFLRVEIVSQLESDTYNEVSGIKGGTFSASSDALASISENVTSVQSDLSEVKGSGFNSSLDSLSGRRSEIPLSAEIVKGDTHDVGVRLGNRTGVTSSDLNVDLLKAGSEVSTTLLSTWQEIDATGLPGLYEFTMDSSDTDTLGDLVVRLSPAADIVEFSGTEEFNPSGDNLRDIYFHTDQTGYVATDSGNLQYTQDGGDSWTAESVANEQHAIDGDRTTGFVAVLGEASSTVSIWTGDTNGFTSQVATNLSFEATGQYDITVLPGTSPQTVIVLGDDGGTPTYLLEKWSVGDGSTTTVFSSTDVRFTAVEAIDDTTVFAVGRDELSGDPVVYKSTDAGDSFSEVTLNPSGFGGVLNNVAFTDDGNTGYAVSPGELGVTANGAIFKSTDGGDTWNRTDSSPGVNAIIWDVHPVNDSSIWLTGVDGSSGVDAKIWTSTDSGSTLNTESTSSLNADSAVSFKEMSGIGQEIWTTGGKVGGSGTDSPWVAHLGKQFGEVFPDAVLRFQVVDRPTGTEVSTIDSKVDGIQGSGFTAGDSLENISDRVDGVRGPSFDPQTDSLAKLQEDVVPDLSDVKSTVARIVGLVQENVRITNHSYNNDGKLTSADMDIYPDATSLQNETGEVATYEISATYDSEGLLTDYVVTRTS